MPPRASAAATAGAGFGAGGGVGGSFGLPLHDKTHTSGQTGERALMGGARSTPHGMRHGVSISGPIYWTVNARYAHRRDDTVGGCPESDRTSESGSLLRAAARSVAGALRRSRSPHGDAGRLVPIRSPGDAAPAAGGHGARVQRPGGGSRL